MLTVLFITALSFVVGPSGPVGGCAGDRNTPSPSTGPQVVPSDTQIGLFRTSCYGGCTVYSVIIHADGSVLYNGGENAKTRGEVHSRISREKVEELLAAFNKIDYFNLSDRYDRGKDCPTWGTDMPSAITSLTLNNK